MYYFGAARRWMSLASPDCFSVVRQGRFRESIDIMFRNKTFITDEFSVKSILVLDRRSKIDTLTFLIL